MTTFFPTPELDSLWPQWLAKYELLIETRPQEIAAPFASAADDAYLDHSKRFMLVGQATRSHYRSKEFQSALHQSASDSLVDRKVVNRSEVMHHSQTNFWRAFRNGSKACGPSQNFANAVWNNVAKIGFADRNVDAGLMHDQEALATQTLKSELSTYKPTLVHFVSGHIGDRTVMTATETTDADWTPLSTDQCKPENDIWFRADKGVSMLWTRHPNWASPDLVRAWDRKLIELAQG